MRTTSVTGVQPCTLPTCAAPGAAMKAGSRGATDTKERFGVRRALVVAQVALSLVLVVGAVLFVRSLRNLMTLDAGFQQEGILVVNMDLRRTGIPEERRSAVFAEITSRVAALPGVASAAQAFIVPVSGSGWNNSIVIDAKKYTENVNFNSVSPGYFRTMGTPVLAGRDFDERDAPGADKTASVTAALGAVDRNIIVQFQTLPSMVRDSLLRERLMATLSGFFGALAALIATIGLYGVMSYTVARRRNEIGIRMALGADRRDVVRMVMGEAGVLLVAGVIVGTALAIVAAPTAVTLLFGLHPSDPATLAMAAAGLGA